MEENNKVEEQGGTPTPREATPEIKVENDKVFSKEEVNDIVSGRINRLFGKLGVVKTEELEALVSKGKEFDKLKADYDNLNKKQIFYENNISKEREDDVITYFKGKGLEFNSQTLVEVLKTHPEWKNKTVVSKIGSTKTDVKNNEEDDSGKKVAEKLFGFDF